ncbi:MAG: YdcF family protein [Spirochaetia bacterium]|nr:YdcF family protein [Spirochaetia bacterium]
MFFFFSKILPGLFFPYPLFLIFALLAGLRLKAGRFKKLFFILWFTVTLGSSYVIAAPLMRSLESRYTPLSIPETPRVDAIVVLTGMVTPLSPQKDRPEFSSAVDRILAGMDLLKNGKAPLMIVTGGSGLISQLGEPEATVLRTWLIGQGIPDTQIITESNSRNTAENASQTAAIASNRGIKKIILVTSAFHMWRSVLCFEKAGLEVVPFPVDYYIPTEFPGIEAVFPHSAGMTVTSTALKEYAGILAYRLKGYL